MWWLIYTWCSWRTCLRKRKEHDFVGIWKFDRIQANRESPLSFSFRFPHRAKHCINLCWLREFQSALFVFPLSIPFCTGKTLVNTSWMVFDTVSVKPRWRLSYVFYMCYFIIMRFSLDFFFFLLLGLPCPEYFLWWNLCGKKRKISSGILSTRTDWSPASCPSGRWKNSQNWTLPSPSLCQQPDLTVMLESHFDLSPSRPTPRLWAQILLTNSKGWKIAT